MNGPFSGLLVPMLTPFTEDLSIDTTRAADYCQSLLDDGADGIVLLGTTGEANSLTADERRSLLETLCRQGIPAERFMVGIGGCSWPETAAALQHSAQQGAAAVLMLPPFFYKQPAVGDDGLFEFVSRVIDQTSGAKTPVYLYHIPQVTQIGWSFDLIRRLVNSFPDRIVGIKDSAGDWEHTKQLIAAFPELDVFPGFELTLLQTLRTGGVGCITATGNVNLKGIRSLCQSFESAEAESLQEQARTIRLAVQEAGPPITVMKSLLAAKTNDPAWAAVRPPLSRMPDAVGQQLDVHLRDLGWSGL